MLTPEVRERIHAEEVFRLEVRQHLEKRDRKGSRKAVWDFLNSAIFLWFLSTVAVGSASFWFARWSSDKEAEKTRSERVQRLDAEIASRLRCFADQSLVRDFTLMRVPPDVLVPLDAPLKASYPINVFPEYERRSLHSLLWELIHLVPEAEKVELQKAYDQSAYLQRLYLLGQERQQPASSSEAERPEGSTLVLFVAVPRLEDLNLGRWGNPLKPILSKELALAQGEEDTNLTPDDGGSHPPGGQDSGK
jgi:hypothetical protein